MADHPQYSVRCGRYRHILHLVPRDPAYVWLDLVCIPQTRVGDLGNVARQEIGRQAAIFSLADSAVAWFCNSAGFGSLEDRRFIAVNAAKYPGTGPNAYEICCHGVEKLFDKFQITEWNVPLRRSQFPRQGGLSWDEFLYEWSSSSLDFHQLDPAHYSSGWNSQQL
jgi:hypothetical protein